VFFKTDMSFFFTRFTFWPIMFTFSDKSVKFLLNYSHVFWRPLFIGAQCIYVHSFTFLKVHYWLSEITVIYKHTAHSRHTLSCCTFVIRFMSTANSSRYLWIIMKHWRLESMSKHINLGWTARMLDLHTENEKSEVLYRTILHYYYSDTAGFQQGLIGFQSTNLLTYLSFLRIA